MNWTDNGEWSHWCCATCDIEQEDPDTIKVTTCSKGHTNYLGPVEGNWRKAYKTAKARAKDIREHNALVQMMSDAIRAGRKTLEAQGRKPNL